MPESKHLLHTIPIIRHLVARPRLLICTLLGIACFAAMSGGNWHLSTRLLLSWNIGTWLYIAFSAWMMAGATEDSIKRNAAIGDESRFVVLTLAIAAACISLGAIIGELGQSKGLVGLPKGLHIGLAGITIVSAWTFIHLIFTQHYAHEYFIERGIERDLPPDESGGLRFPGSTKPTFIDFLYFSFVIAVAAQTADVETTSRYMRAIVLIHCVLSFFFNTTVLALTINIAASLMT